jgi:hypothetical protein
MCYAQVSNVMNLQLYSFGNDMKMQSQSTTVWILFHWTHFYLDEVQASSYGEKTNSLQSQTRGYLKTKVNYGT